MSAALNDIEIARKILRGETVRIEEISGKPTDSEIKDAYASALFGLAKRLKKESRFEYARQLLAWARKATVTDPGLRATLRQQQAVYTYKDLTLRAAERLDLALQILGEEEDLQTTKIQETLGIAGSIYKQKWELRGEKEYLESSFSYYYRGYLEGCEKDYGYTGVNAAYILDILASLEPPEVKLPDVDRPGEDSRQRLAEKIRRDLTETLPPLVKNPPEGKEYLKDDWWVHVTIAEAYFGLGEYGNALTWLMKAKQELEPEPWQYETTAIQLGSIAHLQSSRSSRETPAEAAIKDDATVQPTSETPGQATDVDAWNVLREFLGEHFEGVRTARVGKVGLSLSGGGFRAALFHIGVLARLAELDVLRRVEVLSCVSGGSIVGALYYLEVRNLLQSKADEKITREDYIEIVQRLERNLLSGAQQNIRMRTVSNLLINLRAIFQRGYSQSQRIGDVLESKIFALAPECKGQKSEHEEKPGRYYLNELSIAPVDEDSGKFSPLKDNWRRAAKVPVLVLNALTLNTGHNWQFTTSQMGESSMNIDSELDRTARLSPVDYEDAPEGFRQFRLGQAVAASTCIPGLFEPIALKGLYEGMTVRLVDGMILGNPSLHGLVERDCRVMLVSDGAGRLNTAEAPGNGFYAVPLRSNSIAMWRIRQRQYEDLLERRRSLLLRGLMFVHLLKDVDTDRAAPVQAKLSPDSKLGAPPAESQNFLTSYGIRKDVQQKLSAIRTDLDTFSDVEAYALMTSGYRMTEYEFPRSIEGFQSVEAPRTPWRFLSVEEPMKRVGSVEFISGTVRLLTVASERGLKVWRLSRLAQAVGLGLGLALILGLLWLSLNWWSMEVRLTVKTVTLVVISFLMALFIGKLVLVLRQIPKTLTEIGLDLGMAFFGWLAANLYLLFLDPLYLSTGRVHFKEPAGPIKPTPGSISSIQTGEPVSGAASANGGAIKNLGDRIQQGKNTVSKWFDQSDASTNKFADRLAPVETIGRLFEAVGYTVFRFPRTPELNPLQINLDLVLQQGGTYICVEVKTPADQAKTIDWTTALELQTASLALQGARSEQSAQTEKVRETPMPEATDVQALLVLVDVAPTKSLESFSEENFKLVSYTSAELRSLTEKAGEILNSPTPKKADKQKELQALLEKLLP